MMKGSQAPSGHQHAIDLDSLAADPDGPIPMITTPKGVSVEPRSADGASAGPSTLAKKGADGAAAAAAASSSSSSSAAGKAQPDSGKDENFITNALKSEVSLPKTEDEKKKFHKWLFKLANPKEQNKISAKELGTLLKALENDGITPDELLITPASDVEGNVKEIIEEYGSNGANAATTTSSNSNVGYITEEQFYALAKCITDNYDLSSMIYTNKKTHSNCSYM